MEIQDSWKHIFNNEKFNELTEFLTNEYSTKIIYPPKNLIFNAFNYISFNDVKVLILGQDPYHDGQANGLAFSVDSNKKIPPSLNNIFKELTNDIPNFKYPIHGNLINWSKQGVLLLNSTLTVESKKPNSHLNIGWEYFTDKVIKELDKKEKMIFVFWGNFARKKKELLRENHLIIESSHPSPYSAAYGFFGSKCFSKINNELKRLELEEIDWNL